MASWVILVEALEANYMDLSQEEDEYIGHGQSRQPLKQEALLLSVYNKSK